jgi:hypothetical protein
MRLTEAIRKRIAPTPDEREVAIAERHYFAQEVAGAIQSMLTEGGAVRVRLDQVGPMGGVSDLIVVQDGSNAQTARFYRICIYANGVMAE